MCKKKSQAIGLTEIFRGIISEREREREDFGAFWHPPGLIPRGMESDGILRVEDYVSIILSPIKKIKGVTVGRPLEECPGTYPPQIDTLTRNPSSPHSPKPQSLKTFQTWVFYPGNL